MFVSWSMAESIDRTSICSYPKNAVVNLGPIFVEIARENLKKASEIDAQKWEKWGRSVVHSIGNKLRGKRGKIELEDYPGLGQIKLAEMGIQ